MVCDWVGAGKVYSKEKWTQETPLEYYYKVRAGRHFHPDTEALLLAFLTVIAEEGLEGLPLVVHIFKHNYEQPNPGPYFVEEN